LNAAPLSSQSPSPGRAQQHPTTSPISALIALVKKSCCPGCWLWTPAYCYPLPWVMLLGVVLSASFGSFNLERFYHEVVYLICLTLSFRIW